MNNISDRLRKVIDFFNLTQADFAESIGTTPATLSRQLKGVHKIDKQVALAIQAVHGISAAWLLAGEGEMFTSPPSPLRTERGESTPPGETPKVMQSDAPQKNGSLAGINGGVDEVDVDIDHVKWFRSLSRKKQTAILAIAEIEDEEYIDEVKGSTLFKLRQQRDIQKAGAENERAIRKKGEAG
jgi:transcriptional regulator with XRE-family HTH domain